MKIDRDFVSGNIEVLDIREDTVTLANGQIKKDDCITAAWNVSFYSIPADGTLAAHFAA